MNQHGDFHVSHYYGEFGSWNSALKTADLAINKEYGLTKEEMVEAIDKLAGKLGHPPTREDM